jgi:hypothetical protein
MNYRSWKGRMRLRSCRGHGFDDLRRCSCLDNAGTDAGGKVECVTVGMMLVSHNFPTSGLAQSHSTNYVIVTDNWKP